MGDRGGAEPPQLRCVAGDAGVNLASAIVLTPIPRATPFMARKYAREVTLVEKSAVRRDSGQALVGVAQLGFGAFDPVLQQPLMGRESGCLFERLGKIACGKAALAREVEDGRIVLQMNLEELVDSPHLPRGQFGAASTIRRTGIAIPYDHMLAESQRNVIDKQ